MRPTVLFALAASVAVCTSVRADATKPPVRQPGRARHYTRGRAGHSIRTIVLHTIEGSARSGINTFLGGARRVSAHYVIDFDGTIYQLVPDGDTAWHAGNARVNRESIGIEHAGYAHGNTWTDAQVRSSARLTRYLCERYGIPKTRSGIVEHREVPGATHTDPGPYFPWQRYLRLVREGDGPTVEPASPAAGQVVGRAELRGGGDLQRGFTGLAVTWRVGATRQQAARVLLEEVGGSLRYDSGSLTGGSTGHRVAARVHHRRTYRYKVRVWDGERSKETDWVRFSTDFTLPTVEAVAPADGEEVGTTPGLRWRYADADGPQAGYRLWLDDDADHTRVIGDTERLDGGADTYFLSSRLQPGRTYYWRVMADDGRGNRVTTPWRSFRTAPGFVHTATGAVSVLLRSPRDGARVASERPVLRWAYHNGAQRPQRAYRVQVDRGGGSPIVNQAFTSRSPAHRLAPLAPGTYRWRVRVWDGQDSVWSGWTRFSIAPGGAGAADVVGGVGQ